MTEQITGAARLTLVTVVNGIFTSIKTIQTCVVFVQKSLLLAFGMVVHFCCPDGARLFLFSFSFFVLGPNKEGGSALVRFVDLGLCSQ